MKRKDATEAENGKIQKESIIDYVINKNGSIFVKLSSKIIGKKKE